MPNLRASAAATLALGAALIAGAALHGDVLASPTASSIPVHGSGSHRMAGSAVVRHLIQDNAEAADVDADEQEAGVDEDAGGNVDTNDAAETPEPSATPEPSETPEPSATPEPSETPEPSATPQPSQSGGDDSGGGSGG